MITIEQAINCTTWKTCTKCGDEKKEVFFSISRGKRKAQCKECDAKAYRAKKEKKLEQAQVKEMSQSLANRIIKWIFS